MVTEGGVEIYRNRLWGALDFGGYDTNDEGSYGYAARVFDNDIGRDALRQVVTHTV